MSATFLGAVRDNPDETNGKPGSASEHSTHMNSERRIELTLTLTAADVFRASMALAWRSLVRVVGLLGLLAILLVVLNSHESNSAVALDPMVTVVILIAVFVGPAYVWRVYSASRRAFRDSRVYRGPLSYVLTEKGLEVKSPTFSAMSDWSNVAQVRETRSLFILRPPTSAMTIIPKRCLPDPSAVQALRELLRDHASGKVK